MSNQRPFGSGASAAGPTLPRGEIVATFDTYAAAQTAVDRLAHGDFPIKSVSIVGSDLKSVERVMSKLSYGRVAISGALTGLWLGLFIGFFFVLIAPSGASLSFIASAALIGAGFAMLFRIVTYSIGRKRRDFTSVMQVIASSYSVVVENEQANKARNLLDRGPASS